MLRKTSVLAVISVAVFVAGVLVGNALQPLHAQSGKKVFEIRTYTANEGKLDALNARFRDHTVKIFAGHGMKSVGYWVPQDGPLNQNTLIYILEHPSREAAAANWKAFGADPEWQKAAAESEKNGKLVAKVDSVFVEATDYSPIK